MLTHEVQFFVRGDPVAQGSKRHVGNGVMVEASKKLRPWRQLVSAEAAAAWNGKPPTDQPLALRLKFIFPRPKGHFTVSKAGGGSALMLKRSAPHWKPSAPDTDKLCRGICDALADAGVVRNDALVVELHAVKVYGDQPGCHVALVPVG
jgi:crossover junction endodeoxyribonuclease RusA